MAQTSLMTWLKKSDVPNPSPLPPNEPLLNLDIPSEALLRLEGPSSALGEQNADVDDRADDTASNVMRRDIPQNVEFRSCTADDIPRLRRLTSLLLPIPYSDSFFREIIEDEVINNITLLAFWHDAVHWSASDKGTLVGAVRCRLLTRPPGSIQATIDGPLLYLSTLSLLSPYRHLGIATQLLDRVIRLAVREYGITSIGAHVWEANEEGLRWYRKRGFNQVTFEPAYYRRLKPSGAMTMLKNVSALDLI